MTGLRDIDRTQFQDEFNQMVLGELLRMNIQVENLKGSGSEEMADAVVGFLNRFIQLFPEDMRGHLKEKFLEQMRAERSAD